MPSSFQPSLVDPIFLPEHDSWPKAHHRFDQESVWAIQTALDIGRPLLLRGEPGIGKSQLARAAAEVLRVPFLYHVVDERTERDDLMHYYDAVARLAEAQVSSFSAKAGGNWKQNLAEKNFIRPGVLWWAFGWASAAVRADEFHKHLGREWQAPVTPKGWTPEAERPCGPVVLIDEIDKADPSVPNGLLECLGNEGFHTAQLGESIRLSPGTKAPLVMITTNEERDLPSAFLRRCLVLPMLFPNALADKEKALKFLEERATGLLTEMGISSTVCRKVAECIIEDRMETRGRVALPGASEFLELLKALHRHDPGNDEAQLQRLEQIKLFVLRKHDPLVP